MSIKVQDMYYIRLFGVGFPGSLRSRRIPACKPLGETLQFYTTVMCAGFYTRHYLYFRRSTCTLIYSVFYFAQKWFVCDINNAVDDPSCQTNYMLFNCIYIVSQCDVDRMHLPQVLFIHLVISLCRTTGYILAQRWRCELSLQDQTTLAKPVSCSNSNRMNLFRLFQLLVSAKHSCRNLTMVNEWILFFILLGR